MSTGGRQVRKARQSAFPTRYWHVSIITVALIACSRPRSGGSLDAAPPSPMMTTAARSPAILLPRLTPYELDPEHGKVAPSIAKPQYDKLIDATRVVLRANSATLIIDYPLRRPARFEILPDGADGAFTVRGLVRAIAERYAQVYAEEEKTASKPAGKVPGLENRNETDGKYGISMHVLDDLVIEGIDVKLDERGEVIVELEIGS
ncbi:MAG: hypothetical protein HY898_01150 [Deltaproteobacteria bacterium]|nr:hypothetical protein [Deltaproteobacteria bacterium]